MGDQQLAVRISDPMLRAWLLMNLRQVRYFIIATGTYKRRLCMNEIK